MFHYFTNETSLNFSQRNLDGWWWNDWRVRRTCSPLDCRIYQKNFFTRCFLLSFKAKHSELRSAEHRALLFSHCGFCCFLITQKTRRWWIVKKVLLLEIIIKLMMDTKDGREKWLRHKSRSKKKTRCVVPSSNHATSPPSPGRVTRKKMLRLALCTQSDKSFSFSAVFPLLWLCNDGISMPSWLVGTWKCFRIFQ